MSSKKSLALHKKHKGKLAVASKVSVKNNKDLAVVYTPGVAEVSRAIAQGKSAYDYTIKGNTVAVVSDGSSVLGLGNIGPEAAMPVMEGKAILFKQFADIDAFPICLQTQDVDEIVNVVRNIAPTFGGINLEDIGAPRCFEVEEKLQDLGIPVMHDDQHGTACVLYAALKNACKVTGKTWGSLRIVINGAGAAGTAIAKLLSCAKGYSDLCHFAGNVLVCDRSGIISSKRKGIQGYKKDLATLTNRKNEVGTLADALKGADVFIGVSVGNVVTPAMVKTMNQDAIVFAMANPIPEIMPDVAKKGGAAVVATGRSDFANQVNNVLAFPGIFRGALDARASKVTKGMIIAAAEALAGCVKKPTRNKILPSVFDKKAVQVVSRAVKKAARP